MPDAIERAEKALEGVTEGPWVANENTHPDDPQWEIESHAHAFDDPVGIVFEGVEQGRADAEFIAASRSLLPELVAELKAARAENERLSAEHAAREDAVKLVRDAMAQLRLAEQAAEQAAK